jgi:hypothetical protein
VQVYLVYRSGGKLEESMLNKSTAAKFISRSKPVAYASASSVNASSCHLPIQNGKCSNLILIQHRNRVSLEIKKYLFIL